MITQERNLFRLEKNQKTKCVLGWFSLYQICKKNFHLFSPFKRKYFWENLLN